MAKTEQREIILLEELKKRNRLTVEESATLLQVSEATLRRLFARLEEEHKLLRVHGGVAAILPQLQNYSFQESSRQNTEFKSQIGCAAVECLRSGDRIFLDAGTTVRQMADEMCAPLRLGTLKNITVVTSSLAIAGEIAHYCETILAGGRIRPERNDVCGAITSGNLARFHFDRAFFGVDGIASDGRLMTTDQETAAVNSAFLGLSSEKIVLADADKFDRTSFVTFSSLQQVNKVITDRRLTTATRKRYATFPAQICIAEALRTT